MKILLNKIRRKFNVSPITPKTCLMDMPRKFCDVSHLGTFDQHWIEETFSCPRISKDWSEDALRIEALELPDMTGGVNPGDRRALYYLVRRVKPQRFLEIGTHIGSSTVALALAAARNQAEGIDTRILTVDIRDVNDKRAKPWLKAGSSASPYAHLASLDLNHLVTFEVNTAAQILDLSTQNFDMIFLDGDHGAEVVYSEIPRALKRLGCNGMIILHDFFPNLQTLWPGQIPLPGPFQAVERILSEGAGFHVIPFGELPWATKLGSKVTSLALLSKQV